MSNTRIETEEAVMAEHFIFANGVTFPQQPTKKDVNFREIGLLLARKPWAPGLFHGAYSYADHLINLAENCPPSLKQEALIFFAHAPFDEPVAPMLSDRTNPPRTAQWIRPVNGPNIFLSMIIGAIREAANLPRQAEIETLKKLALVQKNVIEAELRDMTTGLPASCFATAPRTKQPIMARAPERAAAIWTDKVEQYIPERMAARNPERMTAS
ncbi:MAG: hypothetical protein OIF56_15095 [Cohaesibacter sp.]|nr:hypothetical protein [Cohaesibacter sp.]